MPPAALPLYRSPALRVFEAAHADHALMARAGAAAAAWAEALADGGRILILAGTPFGAPGAANLLRLARI